MAAWSWKLFMCHTISDYMEQHDVGPLLRSVCIADSYIRGHFTLFHTGDGYFIFWGWLFYILGKETTLVATHKGWGPILYLLQLV